MATKETQPKENMVVISFPFKGYDTSSSYEKQVPLTSPILQNCRLRDVAENRARGGQRPGLVKTSPLQIGADVPVQEMCQIITTYINPGS